MNNSNTQPDTNMVYPKKKPCYSFIKRLFDLVVSALCLVLLSPLFIVVALIIRRDGGKAFYRQTRVGKDGKEFEMYKFRSMCVDADSPEMLAKLQAANEMDGPAFKMKDDPRITPIGHFIRKFSIDELPQLINILKNDMTVVGPRPALPTEVEHYSELDRCRLSVKQGLTCYWQCSGRNNLSFQEWMQLDRKYVAKRGILTDISIILKTIPAVIIGKGAM